MRNGTTKGFQADYDTHQPYPHQPATHPQHSLPSHP
jgi:hypothetical protein